MSILLLPLLFVTSCNTVYVSQCKWAREIRAPEPFKSKLIDTIDNESNELMRFQGQSWLQDIANHNDDVRRFCYQD